MRLSGPASLDQNSLPDLWNTLHRISMMLDISYNQLAEMMELTPSRYAALRRYRRDPPVSSAMALGKRLNIGFEALLTDNFDYKVMARQFSGRSKELPEVYAEHALSRRRLVIPILDYIEKRFGWSQRALVLRRFQMTEAMFEDPHAPINMKFALDMANYLLDYYNTPLHLENMGRHSALCSQGLVEGLDLNTVKNSAEVYERVITGIAPKYIEKNYRWRILKLNPDGCVLEGKPSEEMLQIPGSMKLLAPSVCMIRSGFVSYMPNYASFGTAKVRKSACVANGDPVCIFNIQHQEKEAFSS